MQTKCPPTPRSCAVPQLQVNNPLRWVSEGFIPPGICGGKEGAWLSTGLYAPASGLVTITINPSTENFANAKRWLGIQVGSHVGDLFVCRNIFCRQPTGVHLRKWFGNSAFTVPGSDSMQVSSAWGGLIYILVRKVGYCMLCQTLISCMQKAVVAPCLWRCMHTLMPLYLSTRLHGCRSLRGRAHRTVHVVPLACLHALLHCTVHAVPLACLHALLRCTVHAGSTQCHPPLPLASGG